MRLTAPGADAYVSDSVKVADGEYVAHAFPINPEPRPLLEFQVDRPVAVTRGSHVNYPDAMRSRGVSARSRRNAFGAATPASGDLRQERA